jgi:hypothetical protein
MTIAPKLRGLAVGLRRQVSLLRDHGHPDAADYRIATVWDEASIVAERVKGIIATQAVLIQAATATTGFAARSEDP